ncbi:MAG TPA: response regulator, partial [Bacteroidota bacterium]|nr:response regulator [Bacteroidota bacterium]
SVKAVILVADDDTALADIITERLREQGYSVITINSLAEAMKTVETTSVDLILSDIQFKGEKGDGFTFFKFVQQKPHLRRTPFILMSSLDEGLFIRTGVQLGVDDYLTKPLDIDLLLAVVEGKLKKYRSMYGDAVLAQ